MHTIEKHPEIPWKYNGISDNPNLTIDFLKRHLDREWKWNRVTKNPNIYPADIVANPDLPWDYDELSCNPNVTLDFVKKHPEIPWNRCALLLYSEIEAEKIYEMYGFPPFGYWLTPKITLEFIEKHPDVEWWKYLPYSLNRNPNLTLEFVKAHSDKNWDMSFLSRNRFKKHSFFWGSRSRSCAKTRLVLNELLRCFDRPPNSSLLPVFKGGGVGYKEGLRDLKSDLGGAK